MSVELNEENPEAPVIEGLELVDAYVDPTHRRLRAIAGHGNAYIFLTIPKDEDGDGQVVFAGIYPEDVTNALREVADVIDESQPKRPAFDGPWGEN